MTAYDRFTASMFGATSKSKVDFLKNEMNSFNQKLSELSKPLMGGLVDSFQWVKNKIAQTHDDLFSSRKLNEIRDYLFENGTALQDGYLHKLNLVDYRCNVDTKEFILNHPTVFRFEKYGFLNNFNNQIQIDRRIKIPEFRTEYIKTYDGVVRRIGENEVVTKYFTEKPLEDISFSEISIRMEIWEAVTKMLGEGLDPTEERGRF